jgi:hypothetical protein
LHTVGFGLGKGCRPCAAQARALGKEVPPILKRKRDEPQAAQSNSSAAAPTAKPSMSKAQLSTPRCAEAFFSVAPNVETLQPR